MTNVARGARRCAVVEDPSPSRCSPSRSPPADGRLRVGERHFERVDTILPVPPPARWRGLIGEYGWDHNVLYVFEESGELHALVEWLEDNPLRELGEDRFAFAEAGVLYAGEELSFERDSEGTALRVRLGELSFERRHLGAGSGETFRIDPVRPVEDWRSYPLLNLTFEELER